MMNIFKKKGDDGDDDKNNHLPFELKNPFNKESIVRVSLEYKKVLFEKHFSWKATIKFRNGDTEGVQNFEVTDIESDNAFKVIVEKIQTFISNLNKQ